MDENQPPQPTDSSPPAPGPTEEKVGSPLNQGKHKKKSGCSVALIVLGVIALLGLGMCGVCSYQLTTQPEFKKMMEAGVGMFNAPGREELQEAGCAMAIIMDLQALAEFDDDGKWDESDFHHIISCVAADDDNPPSCSDLAPIFIKAQPQPFTSDVRFAIVVQSQAGQDPICTEAFDGLGESLGPLAKEDLDDIQGQKAPGPSPMKVPRRSGNE